MMKKFNLYNRLDLLAQDIQVEALAEAEAKAEVQIKDKSDQILVKTIIKVSLPQVITRVRHKVEVYFEDSLPGLEGNRSPTKNNLLWLL